jgi:hypothetical protein
LKASQVLKEVKGTRIGEVQPKAGLPKTTYHAKPRTFPTVMDRISMTGEHPITLDVSNALRLYNREFGTTLANNKLLNSMKDTGLSEMLDRNAPTPLGWKRMGDTNTIVPEELYNGLRAIIEPNFMARIDELRRIGKYQGLVKTIDLSVALFHHFTMAMQAMYETKFGLELALPRSIRFLRNADIRTIQLDGAEHGLMVSNIDANLDVLTHLTRSNQGLARVLQAPGVKQAFKLLERNNRFLFDDMQKYLKVMTYGMRKSKWAARHPNATEGEIRAASRSIAEATNDIYGGRNWEILGHTPTFQALGRSFLLAPDWTMSNVGMVRQAFTRGPGGAMIRANYISAIIGAGALTEGLNYAITGHLTDKNAPGHHFEIEIPSSDKKHATHISLFRGGIYDVLRMGNLIDQYGPFGGPLQFTRGKLAPFARTGTGLITNTNEFNEKLWTAERDWYTNSKRILGYAGVTGGPVPFGASGVYQSIKKGVTDPGSLAISGTGLGRVGMAAEGVRLQPDEREFFRKLNSMPKDSQERKDLIHRYLYNLPKEERQRIRYKILMQGR